MNKFSILRPAALVLFFISSTLLGCTKKETVDPAPTVHSVEVRTTAVGIALPYNGALLNAVIKVYGTDVLNRDSEFATSVVDASEATPIKFTDGMKYQQYRLQVQLNNTHFTLPADLRVEARLYIDGVLRTTAVMDKAVSQKNQSCTGTGPARYCTASVETTLNAW